LKNLPIKVSKDVEKQLNDSVLRAIEEWKNNVEEVLRLDKDLDWKMMKPYLEKMWYQEIKVRNVSYDGDSGLEVKFNF
jgi:hypothetical protein